MKANSIFAKVSAIAVTLATLAANVSPLLAEGETKKDQSVTFYGAVTDAGQVVDKMTIDYGELDNTIIDASSIDTSTFKVHFKSTTDYGTKKD